MLRPDVDRVFDLINEKNYQPFEDRGNIEYIALERLCADLVPQKEIQTIDRNNYVVTKTVPDYQGLEYMDLIELLNKSEKVKGRW